VKYLSNYISTLDFSLKAIDLVKVEQLIGILDAARKENKMIFTCGNGGSASTASHWATDLVKGASYERSSRFKVICLNESIPTLTAYSNDVSYDQALVEQLKNFASANDVFIAISGSGNSSNVLQAIQYANEIGCKTIAFTGRDGGELGKLAQLEINVPDKHMGRIEDLHLAITHMISWFFIDPNL
jgi:D-sedoheptulose 7-phosphate isomerase